LGWERWIEERGGERGDWCMILYKVYYDPKTEKRI
jgi:hypothetical protein